MIGRSHSLLPPELPLRLADRHVIDARVPLGHVALRIEAPVLIAVRAKPLAVGVVPLVDETHRDAVAGDRPELLDQAVLLLLGPLPRQERLKNDELSRKVAEVMTEAQKQPRASWMSY